jgi:GNAT superfamily N-acetyltransferase
MVKELTIREAVEDDIQHILPIYVESGISGHQTFSLAEAVEQFRIFQRYPYYRVFVAEIEGAIVAVYSLLIMDKIPKRGAKAGIVDDVAVSPAAQRRGIGKAMMEHARAECRNYGCYKLTLSSNLQRVDAHRFYESLGFERHGYSFMVNLTPE